MDGGGAGSSSTAAAGSSGKVVKPLSKKKLAKFQEEHENRGVCYISRVPPYLKPSALREMLSGMGTEVLRVYLAPEPESLHKKRIKSGGNKKKSFTEGWVEFANKKRAMRIARTLNNTQMTPPNNHRSFYAHDLWNIKYLHRFKWHHLTEKVAYEARLKQDKMKAELAQAKKETNFYLQKVGQAKAIDAMAERRKRKAEAAAAAEGGAAPRADGAAAAGGGAPAKRQKRAKAGAPEAGATAAAAAAAPAAGAATDAAAGGLRAVRRRFKQRRVVQEEGDGDLRLLKRMLGQNQGEAHEQR